MNDLSIIKEIKLKNGQLLTLRRPRKEDAAKMIKYLNVVGGESDNLLFGAGEFHFTVEQEEGYLERICNDPNTCMVLGFVDDAVVSISQIASLGKKRIAHNSELSISVLKEYWGIGVGSAVMDQLIQFAREHKDIKNIGLGVKASNTNAIKLYEKFGFKEIGVHQNYFNINGVYDDEILMDLYLE